MSNRHDYWYWENILNNERIIEINNFIENNFMSLENKDQGAKDLKGNYKKNSTVKIISFELIKKLIPDLIDNVFLSSQQNFGYNIFYPNNLDSCNTLRE